VAVTGGGGTEDISSQITSALPGSPCSSGGGTGAFDVNGTPLISTSTINFENGTGVTVSNPSAGNVQFAAAAQQYLTLKHNGTPLTDQILLNFNDATPAAPSGSSNVTWQPDSGGDLSGYVSSASVMANGFQPQIIPPIAGQFVFVPFTSNLIVTQGTPGQAAAIASNTSGLLTEGPGGGGFGGNTLQVQWSNPVLPAGITAGQVTAVYCLTYGYTKQISYAIDYMSFTCTGNAGSPDVTPPGIVGQRTGLVANSGTGFSSITAFAQALRSLPMPACNPDSSADPYVCLDRMLTNTIGLLVYYTGTPVTPSNQVILQPPLFFNSLLGPAGTLGIDPYAEFPGRYLGSTTIGNLYELSIVPEYAVALVIDQASPGDCTVGGGTLGNSGFCQYTGGTYPTGTWTAFSPGGGCTTALNCPPLNNTTFNGHVSGNQFVGDVGSDVRFCIVNSGNFCMDQVAGVLNFSAGGLPSLSDQPISGAPAWTVPGNGGYCWASGNSGTGAPAYCLSRDTTTTGQIDVGTTLGDSSQGVGLKWIGPNAATPPTGSATGYPTGAWVPAQNGQWAWNNGGTFQSEVMTPASFAQNGFWAGPSSAGAGAPTVRAIVSADVPTLNQNTTGSAGSVANALTGNNSNSGAASGATFNGSAAVTLSANTLGAGSLANANTWSAAGALSQAAATFSGAPITGGSGTTTYPLIYANDGTGPSTWSTAGTELGINAPTGFTGNFLDFHVNGGASVFAVTLGGSLVQSGAAIVGGTLEISSTSGDLIIPSGLTSTSSGSAQFQFAGSTATNFRTAVYGSTSTTIGVGNNYAGFIVSPTLATTPATGTNAWLANAVIDTLGTVTSGGSTITNTANLFVDVASATGTNKYSIYSAGPVALPSIDQTAASSTGGTCAMGASTSCTITIGTTYTTPVCIATQQSATLTGGAVGCTVSGTTVTITSAVANSETWGALVFGNPK
jgi:hypothetical protein